MGWLHRRWAWLVGGVLLAAGVLLAVFGGRTRWLRALARRLTARGQIDLVSTRLAAQRAEVDRLRRRVGGRDAEVARIEAQIRDDKIQLEAVMRDTGASAAEIAAAFRRVGVDDPGN